MYSIVNPPRICILYRNARDVIYEIQQLISDSHTGDLEGGAAAWNDHRPWVLLGNGMRAAPREESGVSAGEATLQQQLVV